MNQNLIQESLENNCFAEDFIVRGNVDAIKLDFFLKSTIDTLGLIEEISSSRQNLAKTLNYFKDILMSSENTEEFQTKLNDISINIHNKYGVSINFLMLFSILTRVNDNDIRLLSSILAHCSLIDKSVYGSPEFNGIFTYTTENAEQKLDLRGNQDQKIIDECQNAGRYLSNDHFNNFKQDIVSQLNSFPVPSVSIIDYLRKITRSVINILYKITRPVINFLRKITKPISNILYKITKSVINILYKITRSIIKSPELKLILAILLIQSQLEIVLIGGIILYNIIMLLYSRYNINNNNINNDNVDIRIENLKKIIGVAGDGLCKAIGDTVSTNLFNKENAGCFDIKLDKNLSSNRFVEKCDLSTLNYLTKDTHDLLKEKIVGEAVHNVNYRNIFSSMIDELPPQQNNNIQQIQV
ncbi:hypothetical protein [Lyticum sinuosum]|uniref:Uncharacterized protein n=1 Tax=Lyticum sinuosum TaxID=1332059 RepID=A0AAE4VKK6_9RICK|nr:hypothetical protein [Lyticum sinuosum]MDZ5760949.1 hypothetical protein [Lyticum sinuosum]